MCSGYTELGKELREIRIRRGEILKNMADKLGFDLARLSGIECGKQSAPPDFLLRLKELYALADEEAARLEAVLQR